MLHKAKEWRLILKKDHVPTKWHQWITKNPKLL